MAADIPIPNDAREAALSVIAGDLAKTFNAPRERIHADVSALLGGLAEKKLLEF